DDLLNKRSGMLGLGGANDMREVDRRAAGGDQAAVEALDVYCYRLRKYVGAYAAALGRLDALVFTAGVGENNQGVRAGVCSGLEAVAGRLDLQVSVREVTDEVTAADGGGARYAAAVYGADRPGLVARVSEALAAHQVNIVDLQTRVIGEPDPVYAMHFELEVP